MAYLGKTPSQAVRQRYTFTASGAETSISGADDSGNTLTFTDGGYVDVYLNGVLLVAGTDYNTTTANTIGGLSALSASDVVEIVVYDVFSVFGGDVNGDLNVNGALSSETATFNRNTTDGTIVDLTKDGTTVGSIGVDNADNAFFSGNASHSGIMFGTESLLPYANESLTDATEDLGISTYRWRDLYLSGGVYLGGTDAANYLDDYEEGTWTPANGSNLTVNSVQNAKYTKIGNTVVFTCWFKANPTASTIVLDGLPFSQDGRTAATWHNITQVQAIPCQVVGDLIYGYGATTSGTNDDMFVSVTIHNV